MTKCIIIAEAGVNHNGSVDIAMQLIDAAADAGVDYIKFQTFITELNISRDATKASYQIANTNNESESQFDMVKKLELSFEEFRVMRDYCKIKNVGFLSTGFDQPSIDFLDGLSMDYFKIPSGEITNVSYLQHIARKGKSVIMSTGMADLKEVEDALIVLTKEGLNQAQITVLHCNTEYPTPMKDVNLKAMITIRDTLKVNVGYSDHTKGIEVPIAAVALGATVIEKHFTIDRNMPGPDHLASLEPDELKAMVTSIRNIELAISGNGLKETSPSEMQNKNIARKSIHIAHDLRPGAILEEMDLIMKRPGDGISPMMLQAILGRKLKHNLPADHKLSWEDLG